MIVMKIKLYEDSSGALNAEFSDGLNGISQNNSGKNVIQVVPEGFRLAEDEVLRIAFSTSLNENDPDTESFGFTLMARDFTDGSWKFEVPSIVSARRGIWYLDLQAASVFNESMQTYDYKRHLTDKLSFPVNASLTDVNGNKLTPEAVQSVYEAAKSAIAAAEEVAAPGWTEKIEKTYKDVMYFLKDGGTIGGDVRIGGNLYLEGTSTVVDSDTIKIKDNIIVTNSGGLPLTGPSGLLILTSTTQAYGVMYEPSMDCVVVGLGNVTEYEENGEKKIDFSFLAGEKQALATRSTTIYDGNLVCWSKEKSTLEDSGKSVQDFALALDVPNVDVAEMDDGSFALNITQNEAADAGVNEPIFPVGFVYITLGDESPAECFGGAWEKITNRFLVGAGDVYNVGKTGGTEYHSHRYKIGLPQSIGKVQVPDNDNPIFNSCGLYDFEKNAYAGITSTTGSAAASFITNTGVVHESVALVESEASVSSMKSIPPYLAVNMWKRIA